MQHDATKDVQEDMQIPILSLGCWYAQHSQMSSAVSNQQQLPTWQQSYQCVALQRRPVHNLLQARVQMKHSQQQHRPWRLHRLLATVPALVLLPGKAWRVMTGLPSSSVSRCPISHGTPEGTTLHLWRLQVDIFGYRDVKSDTKPQCTCRFFWVCCWDVSV